MRYCPACKMVLASDSINCPKCGAVLMSFEELTERERKKDCERT